MSSQLFGKAYHKVTATDLNHLVEEMLRSLFLIRKNMPDNFPDILNLALWHPNLDFLDRNNIIQGLRLFDFDVDRLNAATPLAQTPVLLDVAQLKPQDQKRLNKPANTHIQMAAYAEGN